LINENASVSDQVSALVDFIVFVTESAISSEQVSAGVDFAAQINESVEAADEFIARLLWEVINNSQPANWDTITTQN
jgi:hypothetical protein